MRTTDTALSFSRVRNQRGVTLVESLVALALLGMGAAAVGNFMTDQIRHASVSHLSTQAYSHAADELERIRALPFSQMAGSTFEIETGDVQYGVTSNVVDGVPAPHMKSVDVTVGWNGPGGSRSVDVYTVYTQITPE